MSLHRNSDVKDVSQQVEDIPLPKVEVADTDHGFTKKQQMLILRHVDRRLVLTCGFIYCISLMDRTNLGIAVLSGMKADLNLIGERYNIITLVFMPTYSLFMPLANVMLKKLGARAFLPTVCLLWGASLASLGFIKSWGQAIPLRLLMGAFEAGCFPGCAYLLSCWYTRYELQKRVAVFYMVGILSQAFSGILGYAFSQLEGHGVGASWLGRLSTVTGEHGPGLAGWRWIFILQGVITMVIALIAYITIVNFPENAHKTFGLKFLTKAESDWIVARLEADREDVHAEKFNLKKFLSYAKDFKSWCFALIFLCNSNLTYSLAYFLPIILRDGMGFGVAAAQCLTAPPHVFSLLFMYGFAWAGDRYRLRSPTILVCGTLSMVGLALLGFAGNTGARYFGVFLTCIGSNSTIPALLAWQANNVRGQWKRAFSSALMISAGGVGGIMGSLVFRSQDAPAYIPGIITGMASGGAIFGTTVVLIFYFWRANQRAAHGEEVIEGLERFRYTL
ncbi:uncharacterized protein PV07_05994 [Cladophialophora immunda]|uniref:Major facilitator superfamily (MFS) profile domain-containing protein n=1 Tax=Cladophialophora immunda TaxID=569365 RepID=A0A0D2CJE5_9EURO|nr:uncharacterized protein PV07_05994 [Cladophialophora immunda]KIW30235.1 hypothetical protein PV07_05994 [Cladophialophora immunda]OQU95782.1 hypothetical protein CLAIMM_01953 [Cladophialophora immunda]